MSKIALWDWTTSHREASDLQMQTAYAAVIGNGPVEDFNHIVWNDMVNYIKEIVDKSEAIWYSDDDFLTYSDTLTTEQDKVLTARRFNTLMRQLDKHYWSWWKDPTQKWYIPDARYFYGVEKAGNNADKVYGHYFLELINVANSYATIINGDAFEMKYFNPISSLFRARMETYNTNWVKLPAYRGDTAVNTRVGKAHLIPIQRIFSNQKNNLAQLDTAKLDIVEFKNLYAVNNRISLGITTSKVSTAYQEFLRLKAQNTETAPINYGFAKAIKVYSLHNYNMTTLATKENLAFADFVNLKRRFVNFSVLDAPANISANVMQHLKYTNLIGIPVAYKQPKVQSLKSLSYGTEVIGILSTKQHLHGISVHPIKNQAIKIGFTLNNNLSNLTYINLKPNLRTTIFGITNCNHIQIRSMINLKAREVGGGFRENTSLKCQGITVLKLGVIDFNFSDNIRNLKTISYITTRAKTNIVGFTSKSNNFKINSLINIKNKALILGNSIKHNNFQATTLKVLKAKSAAEYFSINKNKLKVFSLIPIKSATITNGLLANSKVNTITLRKIDAALSFGINNKQLLKVQKDFDRLKYNCGLYLINHANAGSESIIKIELRAKHNSVLLNTNNIEVNNHTIQISASNYFVNLSKLSAKLIDLNKVKSEPQIFAEGPAHNRIIIKDTKYVEMAANIPIEEVKNRKAKGMALQLDDLKLAKNDTLIAGMSHQNLSKDGTGNAVVYYGVSNDLILDHIPTELNSDTLDMAEFKSQGFGTMLAPNSQHMVFAYPKAAGRLVFIMCNKDDTLNNLDEEDKEGFFATEIGDYYVYNHGIRVRDREGSLWEFLFKAPN